MVTSTSSHTKRKFDARKMMDLAVEVMKKSVNEPRSDGSVPPKVGAVLWKPDGPGSDVGTVETAFRGELRNGDHAEFALLERKNRANALDGCILFATLEPCAPGARSHPKLGCAERIVNARIKEVWVGVQDPHPKVGGKGFVYLDKHGVTVRWFDRELQDVIKKENAEFLKQAEMKAEEEDHREEIVLSEYEKVGKHALLADLSESALKDYHKFIGGAEAVDSIAFRRRLLRQGLLEGSKGGLRPTGFATLLFGKHPRDASPEAGLLGTIHYEGGKEELRDFDGPLVTVPAAAIQWLKDKLPNPIDRSGARRGNMNDKFFEMVREGIVNALVHRDYEIKGAKCQLVVTPDLIVVKSPGKPVKPITVEQLQSFDAPMVSRNPMLHVVFSRMEMAEERGLGLKSMHDRASEIGLPLPKYGWEEPFLTLTLYRNAESATKSLARSILDELAAEEQKGWTFLSGRTGTTQSEYASNLGVTARTAQRHLTHFVELGLLRRVGRGPATKYLKP
jgi:ATP-dependent DNA helicase RecG